MTKEDIVKDVPNDQVCEIVQSFMKDNAQKIELVRKFNGKWDITAHFN